MHFRVARPTELRTDQPKRDSRNGIGESYTSVTHKSHICTYYVVGDVVSKVWYNKPPKSGGGRPAVAVRLRRTSRLSADSSSFVKNLSTELTKPRGGCPTTRDPKQNLQSLPLLVTMHMALCMERTSWFIVMLVFAHAKQRCGGG